ncbi:hypothetical protein ACDP63_00690 [Paracoccus sp. P2]|uniref:Uncharacterized protein n=2 Tax=Paracoccaceae TaxID=31989 RepID=A0A7H9BTX3_PARPN|nr:hypothetical protein [Paracoccus pantotrophus]QLH13331.1 hypothetical protein HYQ43_03300 [Paracoccus pantotrophus]RDD99222.1 hypothetical protein DTW92_04045 [Paracoccus pantotrophus]RNI16757.1 hypothetical protein EB844_12890 [Paracoccus pantotrophus]SFN96073.1 hypothetical protein SAMN04244567_00522 [Paracoccus pantotrophus]
MRVAFVLLAVSFLGTGAFAQDGDEFGFPVPIDVQTRRQLLSEAFPQVDNSLKKLDSLIRYRRDLELYRVTHLEAFNEAIEQICRDLLIVEARVSAAAGRGDLSPNEKGNYDRRIAEERGQCSVSNKASSRYYRLYDQFMGIYRDEAASSRDRLHSCYASDPCRLGQG